MLQELHRKVAAREPEVMTLQQRYQSLSPTHRTQQVENRLSMVVEKYEQLHSGSKVYGDRLKSVATVLSSLAKLNELLSQYEKTLGSQETLSSNEQTLANAQQELHVSTSHCLLYWGQE